MFRSRALATLTMAALALTGCSSAPTSTPTQSTTATVTATADASTSDAVAGGSEQRFTAEVWADNWFSLYVNGMLVGEDSVPITTERSFNAETITFTATYPLTIAMVTKDFKETDSGLEYIGTDRQQMGDGGFIAQITDDATGRIVTETSTEWKGLVIQQAPLNTECVGSTDPDDDCKFMALDEPSGWTEADFDDSQWLIATVHTAEEVRPKEGYDTISWDPNAALIWTADLVTDNTILWRTTVPAS